MNNNDLNEILEILCGDSIPDKKQYDIPLCSDSISDEKQNDIPHEKTEESNDDADMELMKLLKEICGGELPSFEVTPEMEEKLRTVSELEKKYTEKFGMVISDDEEYSFMTEDEKIQTIQECFNTNTPRSIVIGGYTPSDDDENQCRFLKHMKIFY